MNPKCGAKTFRVPAYTLLLVLLFGGVANAETDRAVGGDSDRPRVGLVLGGGGARGAAHIGVLAELERMRVPIDAIVGTSMGAIVGGLYASGMSAAELEQLVSTLDWAAALSDSPHRGDLGFRRKQDDEQYPIDLELGIRDGKLTLPQGALQGQKLDLLLRELTLDVADVEDFDELGIPFRAIATDLVSGRPHVLADGDLARAIRASMSVPGAIAPVPLGDRLLADGGLVGNLGVDVMQAFGVDVIIAVDVEFPLYGFEELDSALAISEQVFTILVRNETRRQIDRLSERDVLIQPDLGLFESMSFERSVETLEPGAAATRQHAARLSELSLDEADYAAYAAARQRPAREAESLAFVRVVHDGGVSTELLERQMALKAGDPIDAALLAREANRLYGLRVFEKVGYRLVEEGGATGVEFEATTRAEGETFMIFGLGIEDDFEGSTVFNISTRLWRPRVNRYGAEWRVDLAVGTSPMAAFEFYQPLRLDSRVFLSPRAEILQRNFRAFDVDEAVARFRLTKGTVALDAGLELGNAGEFRIGAYRGRGSARVQVGDPSIPNLSFDIGGAFARAELDTFDNANFPRRGTRADVTVDLSRQSLGADADYDVYSLGLNSAWSRGKSTLVAGFDVTTSHRADSVVQAYVPLGGFLRLSGLERGQISGPHAGVARLVFYRRVGTSAGGLFELPTYFGASLEAGNVWQRRDDIGLDDLRMNGSLFLGLDSYFGPVFLAAGLSEAGGSNFYLFIGALPD